MKDLRKIPGHLLLFIKLGRRIKTNGPGPGFMYWKEDKYELTTRRLLAVLS